LISALSLTNTISIKYANSQSIVMTQSEGLLTLYSGLAAQIIQTIQKIRFTALEKRDDGYCGHRDMLVLEH